MTTSPATRRFTLHYVEMVVAMLIGMLVLGPVWTLAFDAFDAAATLDRPDVMSMSMATNMVVAMSLWMWFRGHTAAPIIEMAVAMYLPFVVLLVPLWLGVLSIGALMTIGHVAMLGTMLYAMLRHRDEYTCHHQNRRLRRRPAEVNAA
ncbi:MAG: hypothetical protein GEV28_18630 [Actinophytocola sp.]|uniref:hypothetical protein n=1 Tax=Actinophytocola sp. TaxID=1872138 RepID=UPI001327F8A0|nr:hypothetical protein [Actinophytocola sp.]MPZ82299.1 hypothetical protein [Actinophytocola sp.]